MTINIINKFTCKMNKVFNGQYRFRMKVQGYAFEIFADPIDKTLGLKHFHMSSLKIVRYEKNRPATANSPLYRSQVRNKDASKK